MHLILNKLTGLNMGFLMILSAFICIFACLNISVDLIFHLGFTRSRKLIPLQLFCVISRMQWNVQHNLRNTHRKQQRFQQTLSCSLSHLGTLLSLNIFFRSCILGFWFLFLLKKKTSRKTYHKTWEWGWNWGIFKVPPTPNLWFCDLSISSFLL